MPPRCLLFFIVLVAVLTGFVAGRMWPSDMDGIMLPPNRPSAQDGIDLRERQVEALIAERFARRPGQRDSSTRAPRDEAPTAVPTIDPARFARVFADTPSSRKVQFRTASRAGTDTAAARKNGTANFAANGRIAVQFTTTYQSSAVAIVNVKPAARERSKEETARLNVARAQLRRFSSAIRKFTRERKRSPYSLHELTLDWTGRPKGYLKGQKLPLDPWGGRYELRAVRDGAVRVVTAGPDGVFGTTDDLTRR